MKSNSLSFRLLLAVGFVLVTFFVLIAMVLEQAFQQSSEQALKEKLQTQIYSLLSVAEMDSALRLKMPHQLREPRFGYPGSGLYANIRLSDHSLVWSSESSVGLELPYVQQLKQGEFAFVKDSVAQRFCLYYAVLWENEAGFERSYIFTVAEDGEILNNQVTKFRTTLTGWLTGIALLLVVVQFLVIRWGLKPLRQIRSDLEKIETREKSRLDGDYPAELEDLAGNLNALISSERAHLERYRNTLADLSHSLKTPLAIVTGCLQQTDVDRDVLQAQISRMNDIIEYQLKKAAARGDKQLIGKIDIKEILKKIIVSLQKVYSSKQVECFCPDDKPYEVYCEEGDIYEIAGNLLDNAFKWCQAKVAVTLTPLDRQHSSRCSVLLTIEDDGPGIASEKVTQILQRGVRADENTAGHGIGMAVVNELVGLLGGKLVSGTSEKLGGMVWKVYLP